MRVPGHDDHFALQPHGRAANAADAVDVEEWHEPENDVIVVLGNEPLGICALDFRQRLTQVGNDVAVGDHDALAHARRA